MKRRSHQKDGASWKKSRAKRCLAAVIEQMEPRMLLSTTALANGAGTDIEFTGPYDTYMPIGSGGTIYNGYSSFGLVDVPASAFALTSGVGGINNLTLGLDNTTISGKYAPTAGSFAVYFIPNDTISASAMRFGGPTGAQAGTNTDLNALGTTTGGASILGVTGTSIADSPEYVGTFSIDTTLPSGYTTWTFSSSAFGSAVAAGIASDLNNNMDVRLAVVSLDNTGHADWAGTNANELPEVQLDYTQVPLVSFSTSNYAVTEAPVGATTTQTITVNRTSDPGVETIIDWSTSDGTAHAPGDYTAASGVLDFQPGVTSNSFTISFNNITTTNPSGNLNLTLTTDAASPSTASFPTNGSVATATITYLQQVNVSIDQSSYSVNEAAGMLAVQLDRTGAGVGSTATSVTITTADGMPYLSDPQAEQNAEAGRDFGTLGSTTEFSQVVHFMAGQTTQTVMIPIIDVKTFAGMRDFTASISDPSTGTAITGTAESAITITDNTVANSQTPTGGVTTSAGVETTGPYYVNSYVPIVSVTHQSLGYLTMPFLEWSDNTPGTGSTVANAPSAVFPTTYSVGTVDSVKLSMYNTANTGSYGGTAGNFDVYFLPDNTIDPATMAYGTVPAGAIYIGAAFMPNNQVGYNDFTFDSLPASVASALTTDLNTGTAMRFVVVPSAGSQVDADWEGNAASNQPQLTLLVEQGTTAIENLNFDVASQTVNKTAGTATIEVDRTGSDLSDTASVQYATSDGTGVAGTDYSTASGTLNFAAGQTQASFTVTILNNAAVYGDKTFDVTLSDPVANGANHAANLGTLAADQVTIHDPRTATVSAIESDNATVQAAGPRSGTNGKSYLNIEGSVNGTSASFGVIDFYSGDFTMNGSAQTINSITLSAVGGGPVQSWYASGPLNVYLVDDAESSIQPGSTLIYDSTDPTGEGVNGQLGGMHLLGAINYSSAQSLTGYTNFTLTGFDASTSALLASDLNNNDDIRIVITPGNANVGAGWEGQSGTPALIWPTLSINYTLAGTLPAWVAPGSAATWDSGSDTLTVNGATTIVGDPGATNPPVISATGAAAQVTVAPTDGSRAIHLGGLNLSSGAGLSIPHSAAQLTLMVGAPGGPAQPVTLVSPSTLDIADNILIVETAPANKAQQLANLEQSALLAKGGGAWTGSGLSSSAVANDVATGTAHAYHTTLAIADNESLIAPFTTYGGVTVDSNSIIITRALVGDGNLDGTVNNADLVILLTHYGLTGQSLTGGDYDGDGTVNNADLVALLTDYGQHL